MKLTRLHLALFAVGTLTIFAAGFLIGGVYGAARAANAASLVYFSAIHDALDRQKYDVAASMTNTAVDGHIGALRALDAYPWTAKTYYVLPWGHPQEKWITSIGLENARKSYAAHFDKLRPETRDFLAASH